MRKTAVAKNKVMEAIGLEQQLEMLLLHFDISEAYGVKSWHAFDILQKCRNDSFGTRLERCWYPFLKRCLWYRYRNLNFRDISEE